MNTNERLFFFVYVYKRARFAMCIFMATQQSIIDLTNLGGSSGHLVQLRVRDEAIDGKQGLQLHLHLHRLHKVSNAVFFNTFPGICSDFQAALYRGHRRSWLRAHEGLIINGVPGIAVL